MPAPTITPAQTVKPGRVSDARLVLARMEIARLHGKGIYLSLRALGALHVSNIGEIMAECAEEAPKPAQGASNV